MPHTGGTAGVIRYYSGPEAGLVRATRYRSSDGASDPFGGAEVGTGTVLGLGGIFDAYWAVPSAGRTTVGANPRQDCAAQFKRGSRSR